MFNRIIIYLVLLSVGLSACSKYLDTISPKSELDADKVFTSDKNAESAVAGMYSSMYATNTFLYKIRAMTGNAADEFYMLQGSTYNQFRNNAISTGNNDVLLTWSNCYAIIYQANAVIEGLEAANSHVSDALKAQLKGEALFIRAFCHFYLVNFYGPVPVITATDISKTAKLPRMPVTAVYDQVISDLKAAASLLAEDYAFNGGDRSRACKWAAIAMLARAYLYTGKWAEAEAAATEVISHTALYTLQPLDKVFPANSEEAIWQFNTIGSTFNDGFSYEGYNFINGNDIPTFVLTTYLADAFESGDQRKLQWTSPFLYNARTYYYPYKYKLSAPPGGATPEYQMVLRLAEQYLVRAEARAQQGNLDGARADVDNIRQRAGLAGTTAGSKTAMLLAIEQERRVELFLEYGHRWFDLKRTGRANEVLGAIKPQWKPTAVLFPVPQKAVSANPALLPNNEGY